MTSIQIRTKVLDSNRIPTPEQMEALGDQFADEVIVYDILPDDYFDLLLQILCSPSLCAIPGVATFVSALGVEPPKLSGVQLAALVDTGIELFQTYTDEDLCLVLCDMFARKCGSEVAVDAFEAMMKTPHRVGQIAIAVGLEVVLKHSDHGSSIYERAQALYEKI